LLSSCIKNFPKESGSNLIFSPTLHGEFNKCYIPASNENFICAVNRDFDGKILLKDFEEFLSGISISKVSDFSVKNEIEGRIFNKDELAKLSSILDGLELHSSFQALPVDGVMHAVNILKNTAQSIDGIFITETDSEYSTNAMYVTNGIDASIILLRILTSRDMPKILYVEDNINIIAEILKVQLVTNVLTW
jgi:hypothetical protein